jgi:glycine/D-amino acid oxidase-like deaminating enzyme
MSGHGFKISPMIGKAMAELIIDGKSKEFDLQEYRYSRFEEGKTIQVPLEYAWGEGS